MKSSRFRFFSVLLMLVCGIAQAADFTSHGDWGVAFSKDRTQVLAVVVNQSNDVLGEFCFFDGGKCYWAVGNKTQCKEGDSYLFLVNTDEGAVSLVGKCVGWDNTMNTYDYEFDWKGIEGALKDSHATAVAFAMPLTNTQINVIRFSLKGITEATADAEARFNAKLRSQPPKNRDSSDTTL
jgi:hypothetical protein